MATDAATIPPKEGLGALVDELEPELDERQMHFMRGRWLDQTAWLEGKAKLCQRRYYALRLVAIVGGVTVPALVSLNVSSDASSDVASTIAWTTFALSLLVATAVSVEGFFRYGERWRHYRRTAELMKSQGWQFFELSGAYESHDSHKTAFRAFSTAVEQLLADDVDVYIRQVMRERTAGAEPHVPEEPKPAA